MADGDLHWQGLSMLTCTPGTLGGLPSVLGTDFLWALAWETQSHGWGLPLSATSDTKAGWQVMSEPKYSTACSYRACLRSSHSWGEEFLGCSQDLPALKVTVLSCSERRVLWPDPLPSRGKHRPGMRNVVAPSQKSTDKAVDCLESKCVWLLGALLTGGAACDPGSCHCLFGPC